MIQVLKFQSKPTKNRKYEYTLQKNGLYKSNGNQGSEFSSAYFNHLNPVLEVKKDNTVIKIGQTLSNSKVTKMFLTPDKQDVIVHTGITNRLLSVIDVASKPVVAEKPKAPEVKSFDVAAAKKFVKDDFYFIDADGNDLYQEDLLKCCGLTEVGNFPMDGEITQEIEGQIEVLTSKSLYKDKKPTTKEIETISSDEELINEVVVKGLKDQMDFKKSFIAVVNNKEQSYVLKAFEFINQEGDFKGNLDMVEFKSNSTKNKLTLITYTIG